MRGKRSKQYRKLMHQYGLTFSFREPYQVMIDAAIIQDAARFKMRLGSLLESTLHGTIKPMITQCCIRHLYDQPNSPEKEAWIDVAKQAERRRCGHHELETPLGTLECMESVVDPKGSGTNRHRYVVASQDPQVRGAMREKAGVPLVYINRSVMILEPMARASADVREQEERAKVRAGLKGRRGAPIGEKRKREEEDDDDEDDAESRGVSDGAANHEDPPKKNKRARGPKEPNPLSMKKSKKEKVTGGTGNDSATLRKVAKRDPQVLQKAAGGQSSTTSTMMEGVTEGVRKRKRKRKPQETDSTGGTAVAVDEGDEK